MTDFADCAVAIVCRRFHDHRDTARSVALKRNLFIGRALKLASATLDGALDVVLRHIFSFGGNYSSAQPRIAVGISTAVSRSHGDFLDKARKYLAAFRVSRAF